MRKPYANNKGADQPAHPRSLISTFFVHCLDNIIPLVSISEISAGSNLPRAKKPEDSFSRDEAHMSHVSKHE